VTKGNYHLRPELFIGESRFQGPFKEPSAESSRFENAGNQGISNYLTSLLMEAGELKASDIHLEIQRKSGRIRFRIDGVMQDRYSYPADLVKGIISRIKILAELDITSTRKLQEGSLTNEVNSSEDIRVSIIPTIYGEKAVLRILSSNSKLFKLEELGLTDNCLEMARKIFSASQGLILLSGPTGSGKTTTLFAALEELNSELLNIVTLEDPVEIRLEGVNQIQVNTAAGEKFDSYLRAVLRQDPDIIMVGELRDYETASMAVRAALTGHLVLSTLHTTSAAGAVTRLIEMGLPAFLIADTLRGVIGQRLIRCYCSLCAGRGCSHCSSTGFLGRTGIQEVLRIGPELINLIQKEANCRTIEDKAVDQGFIRLEEDGFKKVKEGMTSTAEIRRVL